MKRSSLVRVAACGLPLIATLTLLASATPAADWPQWGGTSERNMVSEEKGLPESFVPGEKDPHGSGILPATTQNVQWSTQIGLTTYSTPVVAGGKIFIGTCIDGQGILKCLDASNGKLLWQWAAPPRDVPKQLGGGRYWFSFHPPKLGLTSSPTVEADRVYLVTHRSEVICLDANGAAPSGNSTNPASQHESTSGADPPSGLEANTARVLWSYDMYENVGTRPSDASHGAVLLDGEVLYVGTCNGVDRDANAADHGELRTPPAPLAPSLIALEKQSGRLLATDDAQIGPRLLHGQWSSPSLGMVGGRKLIFFGGGDGVCYAFEALSSVPKKPAKLKTVWTFDCNPPEYKECGNLDPLAYFARGDKRRADTLNENDGTFVGRSYFIASPVFYKGRVYVAIGQDPEHGRGRGALWCIDAAKTGDITATGRIWCYQGLDRTLSTVSIADGLLYVADVAGRLHCLDAETGQCYWVHETNTTVWASTLAADGKVYLPTVKALWVLAAGKEKKILSQISLGAPSWATPVAANGTLYVTSKNYLWAVHR